MNLGGLLMAGGAQGLANASNMNVQAQNQLEIGDIQHGRDLQRDALREEYLNKRFDKEVSMKREDAKAAGALRDMEYQRNREDKRVDGETEFGRRLQLEGVKESGRNARADKRIAAMKVNGEAGGGSSKGLQLPNGETFTPNSPEYKLAVDIVKSGVTDDLHEAINIVISKGLVSQSANSIQGLTEGTVPAARNMTGQLLGGQQKQQSVLKEWNPKTGKFE